MTDSEIVIDAQGLGRQFGRQQALKGIDLQVTKGEIFGVVGSDGAGKSTLLQLIAGILDPTEGSCRVLGFDTVRQAAEVTSRIGYMAQGFTLYERLTVAENLRFAARTRRVPADEFVPRRDRLLAMAGLSRFQGRREGALSGGMRKKLALCANLIHQPPLLVLDEPGLGVDPLSRRELWVMLEDFRQQGATVIFSTSYMDEAERSDRVAFMSQGELLAVGSPSDLRSRARGRTFLLTSDDPPRAEAKLLQTPSVIGVQRRARGLRFVTASRNGLDKSLEDELSPLGRVGPAPPSLEDAFLAFGPSVSGEPKLGDGQESNALFSVPASAAPSVVVERLTRRFGDFTAVDAVSFDIRPGEIFGLLGANGAGKTTLIRMLCGLLPPSDGRGRVAGADVKTERRRLRASVGYMSQRFSLYGDLTPDENLSFFASAYGLPRDLRRQRIQRAKDTAGLEDVPDRPAARLSGAVRQRLGLACSILHQPMVLFLDEPTSGVDPSTRYRFWGLIGGLAEAGAAVLVTTHNMAEAAYCHRLGLMHEGRLIADGDLAGLRTGLGEDAPETAEGIFLEYIAREQTRARQTAEVAS